MKRVLVADDSSFMRMVIKGILEKNGFEVVAEAENGNEAVEKYIKFKPDIVTLDITMPQKNGIEALKSIKGYDPEAKVVMVSAIGQEVYIKEAQNLGAQSYIVKPFVEEQVIQTLNKLL